MCRCITCSEHTRCVLVGTLLSCVTTTFVAVTLLVTCIHTSMSPSLFAMMIPFSKCFTEYVSLIWYTNHIRFLFHWQTSLNKQHKHQFEQWFCAAWHAGACKLDVVTAWWLLGPFWTAVLVPKVNFAHAVYVYAMYMVKHWYNRALWRRR